MTNRVIQAQRDPEIGEEQIQLLQQLCDACAISGDEGEVRKIVQDQVRPFLQDDDDLKIDALGNVLVNS